MRLQWKHMHAVNFLSILNMVINNFTSISISSLCFISGRVQMVNTRDRKFCNSVLEVTKFITTSTRRCMRTIPAWEREREGGGRERDIIILVFTHTHRVTWTWQSQIWTIFINLESVSHYLSLSSRGEHNWFAIACVVVEMWTINKFSLASQIFLHSVIYW